MKVYVVSYDVKTYHEQKYIDYTLRLREILKTLPSFAKDYFRAIEPTTSANTRISYAYDIRVFFRFLMENNPVYKNYTIDQFTAQDLERLEPVDIEEYMEYLKYRFNLIPAMPRALKRNEDKGVQDYFMLATCYDFEKYILLFYGSTKEFYQVLYNKADSTYRVTEDLVNDLLPDDKNEVSEHYIDPYTLAVEMSAEENDYNLHLQILHIKK